MSRVLRTALARQDLAEIARHIARESQSRETALRFLDTIGARCELYANQPELGEPCRDLGKTVRRFVVASYVIFYEPHADGIQLLRVLHGSRDVPAAWRKRYQ